MAIDTLARGRPRLANRLPSPGGLLQRRLVRPFPEGSRNRTSDPAEGGGTGHRQSQGQEGGADHGEEYQGPRPSRGGCRSPVAGCDSVHGISPSLSFLGSLRRSTSCRVIVLSLAAVSP